MSETRFADIKCLDPESWQWSDVQVRAYYPGIQRAPRVQRGIPVNGPCGKAIVSMYTACRRKGRHLLRGTLMRPVVLRTNVW